MNNVKYIEWMQDSYSQEFLESRNVRKIEINFLDSASAGDEIIIGTEKISDHVFLNNIIRTRDAREICRARFEFA